ncbi:GntR family transcriptional regulator [Roseateles sp. DAIF2]|uniref:GntR family transcriptional regulator n=1 Tax=Roseateles sp. DAIF2 TaxID=2714952 RepID=UPI0018A29FAE|nr:GntR family transcriptional regulator [Roseateles sp. DAIF2]QPF75544.1 GntR family transcriptional regulator [Roseateles sp. DAIF2]
MDDQLPLRGSSMHDGVVARLRAMIFARELAPGALIDEKRLAEQWAISRTPLREALKVLVAEGLLELLPRQGCRVIEMRDEDAADLFPVMAMLEGRCAFEAATKAQPADILSLRQLHEQLELAAAAGDLDAYYRTNHQFHSLVQALAANRWLERVTSDLRKFLRLMRGRQLKSPGRLQASLAEHRRLMAALAAGDAAAAEREMQAHLLAQLAALQALKSLSPGEASHVD